MTRMQREIRATIADLKRGWIEEIANLTDVVDGIECDYKHAKEVAKLMAERDPRSACTE